jgi:hypothetical protein
MIRQLLNFNKFIPPRKKGKDVYTVYLITHKPTNLLYVGRYLGDLEERLSQHLNGYGSVSISSLVNNGATRCDFDIEVLTVCANAKDACVMESYYVNLYETHFPYGLNVERNSSSWTNYKRDYYVYKNNGWCTGWMTFNWKGKKYNFKPNNIQMHIENIAKYQRYLPGVVDPKVMSARLIGRFSFKKTIDERGEAFYAARQEQKIRRNSGNLTQNEINGHKKLKYTQTKIWEERTPEEKKALYKKSLGLSNERMKCPVCGVESTSSNIKRYHLRGKCADEYNKQSNQNKEHN